jgi:hypothetical protein
LLDLPNSITRGETHKTGKKLYADDIIDGSQGTSTNRFLDFEQSTPSYARLLPSSFSQTFGG